MRLELMAALILTRLMTKVREALETSLKVRLNIGRTAKLYSDGSRIEVSGSNLCHRLNEILQLTDKGGWHYCPMDQNPAYIGSKGCQASKLKDNGLR